MQHSIIIVSYNCSSDLFHCLSSLRRHAHPQSEIIVVDNASSDDTQQMVQGFKEIKFIPSGINLGFAEACNVGARCATGMYLTFLNPDTLVTPHWLQRMEAHFGHPQVGAVGPTSNYVAGLQKVQIQGVQAPAQAQDSDAVANELWLKNKGRAVKTRLLIGFCLMIPRKLFWELEGMDSKLFLGNDDLDLSWRLQLKQKELVVASDVFVYHEGQKSFNTESKGKVNQLVQNSTNALYEKLVNYYGGEDKVPASKDLWGMDWFAPTNKGKVSVAGHLFNDPQAHPVWFIWVPQVPEALSLLRKTLQSATHIPAHKFGIINQGNSIWIENFPGFRYEPSPQELPAQTLLNLLKITNSKWIGFVTAGQCFTPFFERQYLTRLAQLETGALVPCKGKSLQIPAWLSPRENLLQSLSRQIEESNIESQGQYGLSASAKAENPLQILSDWKLLNEYLEKMLVWEKSLDVSPLVNQEYIQGHFPQEIFAPTSGVAYSLTLGPSSKNNSVNHVVGEANFQAFPASMQEWLAQTDLLGFGQSTQGIFLNNKGEETKLEDLHQLVFTLREGQEEFVHHELQELRKKAKNLQEVLFLILPDPAHGRGNLDKVQRQLRQSLWTLGYVLRKEEIYTGTEKDQQGPKAYQWQVGVRKTEWSLEKKVSIIILGFNQVKYTRLCIESLIKNTRQNYELILIDNGSQDETREFFESVKQAKVVINKENLGVARGWNQGLRMASGDYICILNNDTVLSEGWLENMVRLCESDPSIGLVGPRSNNISGPQKLDNLEIPTLDAIAPMAAKIHAENALAATEFERITGFCLVFSKKVFKDIGYFDERFGKGNFEDDDYCLRARYLGYRLLFAHDSFVYHFGSVSFAHASVDWRNLMEENRKKFEAKWARGRVALTETYTDFQSESKNSHAENWGSANSTEVPLTDQVSALLKAAFHSYEKGDANQARLLFLKVLDKTPHEASAYNGLGILAFHEKSWQEGLSFFRKALELQPDDLDSAENLVELLQEALEGPKVSDCLSALLADFPHNPVFLRESGLRSGPSLEKREHWKREVEKWVAARQWDTALDFIEKLIREGRELAFAYNALGIIAYQCNDKAEAYQHFEKSLEYFLLDEDVLLNYFDVGILLGKNSEVLACLEKALSMGAGQKMKEISHQYQNLLELSHGGSWNPQRLIESREKNIAAENLIREGLPLRALPILQELLIGEPQNFRAQNNMGLICWYQGQQRDAWKHFELALDGHPGYFDALVNLFDASLALKKIEEFLPRLNRFLERYPEHEEALHMQEQITSLGQKIYEVANFDYIDTTRARLIEGHDFLVSGNLDQATLAYLDVIEKDPDKSSAYNGLGLIAYYRHMYSESYKLFVKAVDLSPLDEDALVNLYESAQVLQITDEVLPRLQSALEVDPCMRSVAEIVAKEPLT